MNKPVNIGAKSYDQSPGSAVDMFFALMGNSMALHQTYVLSGIVLRLTESNLWMEVS